MEKQDRLGVSRQSSEALTLIVVLSACHFVLYAPSPLVWTTRAALGFLLSADLYNFLAGLFTAQCIVKCSTIRLQYFWAKYFWAITVSRSVTHYNICRAVVQRVLAIVAQVVHVWNLAFYYANIEVFRAEIHRYLRCASNNIHESRFLPFIGGVYQHGASTRSRIFSNWNFFISS